MDESVLLDQSSAVASTLSGLIRTFFSIGEGDPVTELPVAQIRVCGMLRDGPHTMSALSKELGISLSAVTQIADRLERSGMVERVCEADDRRVKSLRLTPSGRDTMRRRAEKRTGRVLEALRTLTREEREAVLAGLSTLLDAGRRSRVCDGDASLPLVEES